MRDCRTKGETPLHRAAAFADEETVQLLLDYEAKREAKDVNGDSPLGLGELVPAARYDFAKAMLWALFNSPGETRYGFESVGRATYRMIQRPMAFECNTVQLF